MIKEFIEAWNKNKNKLEQYFRENEQEEYDNYKKIVEKLFELVVNTELEEYEQYDIENMRVIDDGHYQGTEIFVLNTKTYQPDIENYIYTHTYYGSCSGCDTLLAISEYSYGKPTEEQIKGYMTLALHIIQRCKRFEEDDEVGDIE